MQNVDSSFYSGCFNSLRCTEMDAIYLIEKNMSTEAPVVIMYQFGEPKLQFFGFKLKSAMKFKKYVRAKRNYNFVIYFSVVMHF